MTSSRLEAFSDGVLAIVITIMVLELKAPKDVTLESLVPMIPVFVSYLLSFIYIGIYWSNHHHVFQLVERINGKTHWLNLHLLFWLSLIPFATSWMGEHHLTTAPLALYGLILLMSAFAFYILQRAIIGSHGNDFFFREAIGNNTKGKISIALNIVGTVLAFILPWASMLCYVTVALVWIVPDKRFEKKQSNQQCF